MGKTILIGLNNKLSINTNKLLTSISGLLFFIYGVLYIDLSSIKTFGTILGISMILAGIHNIVFGLTAFSKSSKYAMRLKVNNSLLEFKSSYYKPVIKLNWNDIKQIKLDAYQVNFQLDKRNEVFRYRSNSDISKEIKSTLRKIAEEKNITVTGG